MSATKKSKRRKAVTKTCRKVRIKHSKRTRKVCTTKNKKVAKKKIAKKPVVTTTVTAPIVAGSPVPVPSAAAPPVTTPQEPGPTPPSQPPTAPGLPVYDGAFGVREAQRLLWRAGFGPRPGDVDRLVAMGLDAAVASLVHPSGDARLIGPEPHTEDGAPLSPEDLWGHDHCWWLDRMVRSDQPLVERMTLVWHDWFATSDDKVGNRRQMLAQNATLRAGALGSFADLLQALTVDEAMLVWLDGIDNSKASPNENYAREIMELFALGADRGAYTEDDVRQLARAFTGYQATWTDGVGLHDFRFSTARHDAGTKRIFGRTGAFTPQDGVRLCLEHPMHASFFVTKLWSYFVPTPPDEATQAALQRTYVTGGFAVAPVLEAILTHRDFYEGPAMVVPPVVHAAGLLRSVGRAIDTDAWSWLCDGAGQMLFRPPNVSGWDDGRWLDTSTWRGRWWVAISALRPSQVDPWKPAAYSRTEEPAAAVAAALASLGDPVLTDELRAALEAYARRALPAVVASWQEVPLRAMRFNALRLLIATSSDAHAH